MHPPARFVHINDLSGVVDIMEELTEGNDPVRLLSLHHGRATLPSGSWEGSLCWDSKNGTWGGLFLFQVTFSSMPFGAEGRILMFYANIHSCRETSSNCQRWIIR
jgi:hypothetical protein